MNETLLNLKTIIPLMGISDRMLEDQKEAADALELSNQAVNELLEMSHYLSLNLSESFGLAPEIEIRELQRAEINEDPKFPFDMMDAGTRILQFSAEVQYDPHLIESQFDQDSISILGRAGMIGLANDIMAIEMKKKIMNFFLAANIAKPGALGFESGMIYVNGHFNTQLDYLNCDYLDREDYLLESIVRLRDLPIKKVWDWFDTIEGTAFNTAIGSVGRAVGTLSYAFGPGASHLWPQLIWVLLGLESIYAPREQLQKYQLTTNISKFLGKKAVDESMIEQLYAWRLQFIHGGADFPFAYDVLNEHPGFDEEEDEDQFYEGHHYAMLLLVATLQELAERGLTVSPFIDSE